MSSKSSLRRWIERFSPKLNRLTVCTAIVCGGGLASIAPAAHAAGLYQDGAGGRSKAMGGTGVATANDPASALFTNPAALSEIDRMAVQIGVDAGVVQGSFHNRANDHAGLETAGVIGGFAASVPFGKFRVGLGLNPDISVRDDWRYRDALGGADGATSYGLRQNASEIVLLRSALGASWEVTPTFSVGANIALLYNENQLQTAYVFQSQKTLRTAKTRLDLQTDGFGWNGQIGLRWQPLTCLTLGVAYTSRADLDTHGRATGNAGRQFANLGLGGARPDFAYDAEVDNDFPQQVSAGLSWKATKRLTLSAQFDWINWSDAFETLPVRLTNGNNADLNGVVGSRRLNDDIPLRWRDQFGGRFGVEQRLDEHWSVRAGYGYANNPVPDDTLTPLNAPIVEHLLTGGVGFHAGRFDVDAYYQWRVPATSRVHRSGLAAGEYSDSVVELSVQQFGLSVTTGF